MGALPSAMKATVAAGAALLVLALAPASMAASTTAAAGEGCKAVARPGPPPLPGMPPPLDIYCGGAPAPVGAVWVDGLPRGTPEQGPARQQALEQVAQRTLEGQSIQRRMNCGPAQPLGGDASVLLYSCTLKTEGWP